MKLTKCDKIDNHFYDADKYSCCPHCNGEEAALIKKTKKPAASVASGTVPAASEDNVSDVTVAMYDAESDATVAMIDNDDIGQTVGMYDEEELGDSESTVAMYDDTDIAGSVIDEIPETAEMYDDGETSTDMKAQQEQNRSFEAISVSYDAEKVSDIPTPDGQSRCINCFEAHAPGIAVCPHCGYKDGDQPQELYHIFPGLTLNNRYVIGKVLGFGGFGITYKAWDKKLDTVVAVRNTIRAVL